MPQDQEFADIIRAAMQQVRPVKPPHMTPYVDLQNQDAEMNEQLGIPRRPSLEGGTPMGEPSDDELTELLQDLMNGHEEGLPPGGFSNPQQERRHEDLEKWANEPRQSFDSPKDRPYDPRPGMSPQRGYPYLPGRSRMNLDPETMPDSEEQDMARALQELEAWDEKQQMEQEEPRDPELWLQLLLEAKKHREQEI